MQDANSIERSAECSTGHWTECSAEWTASWPLERSATAVVRESAEPCGRSVHCRSPNSNAVNPASEGWMSMSSGRSSCSLAIDRPN